MSLFGYGSNWTKLVSELLDPRARIKHDPVRLVQVITVGVGGPYVGEAQHEMRVSDRDLQNSGDPQGFMEEAVMECCKQIVTGHTTVVTPPPATGTLPPTQEALNDAYLQGVTDGLEEAEPTLSVAALSVADVALFQTGNLLVERDQILGIIGESHVGRTPAVNFIGGGGVKMLQKIVITLTVVVQGTTP